MSDFIEGLRAQASEAAFPLEGELSVPEGRIEDAEDEVEVLYFECPDPGNPRRHVLRRWDSGTGRDQVVASIDASCLFTLTASPDGQTILDGDAAGGTSDLMMIENFR